MLFGPVIGHVEGFNIRGCSLNFEAPEEIGDTLAGEAPFTQQTDLIREHSDDLFQRELLLGRAGGTRRSRAATAICSAV